MCEDGRDFRIRLFERGLQNLRSKLARVKYEWRAGMDVSKEKNRETHRRLTSIIGGTATRTREEE
jgi:hypothetical protein